MVSFGFSHAMAVICGVLVALAAAQARCAERVLLDRLEGDVIQVTNNDGRIRFRPDGTLLSDDRLRWDLIHRISRRANITGPRRASISASHWSPHPTCRSNLSTRSASLCEFTDPISSIDPPRLMLIVERAGGLRPPTDQELSSFDRTFAPDQRLTRQPPGNPDEFRNQVSPVDSVSIIAIPPYIDTQGSIWVPLDSPPEATHRPLDVFDASGVYLGQVLLPRYRFTIHEIGDDYILGVTSDDVGVEYVTMYNLTRPARGSSRAIR
jgi:hypothetical protein